MELLLALIPPAAALLLIAPLVRRVVFNWRAASHALGYTYVPGVFGTLGRIVGKLENGHVEVSLAAGDTMLIELHGSALPYDLILARRGLISKSGEIETGDFQFDGRVSIVGTTTTVFAALPPIVRARIGRLAADGRVTARDGILSISGSRPRAVAELVETIEDAVKLFERMTWSGPIDERLLANFEHERDPAVRQHLFNLLLREGSDRIKQRAVQKGIRDPNPEVRLAAVKALKGAGWEDAVALFEDRKVASRYRAAALRHLAVTFGRERALPLVERALWTPATEICAVAVEAIGGWRHGPALEQLAAMTRREPYVVERVAVSLGRIGGVEAQRILLELLDSPHRRVKDAAIHGLARAGNLEAIAVLSRIRELALRGAVREAISAIQSRCGRQAEGALSLSVERPEQGAVSVAEESGRPPTNQTQ